MLNNHQILDTTQAAAEGARGASRPRPAAGGFLRSFYDREVFDTCRVIMAFMVLVCHIFEPFNAWSFLFVCLYFFFAGYGLQYKVNVFGDSSRLTCLSRLSPILVWALLYNIAYSIAFHKFYVMDFPVAWFLLVYCALYLIWRYCPKLWMVWLSSLVLFFFMWYLGFNYLWTSSLLAFPFGASCARLNRGEWLLLGCVPLGLIWVLCPCRLTLVFLLPASIFLFLFVARMFRVCHFYELAPFVFHFYMSHVLFLGLFKATWCYGYLIYSNSLAFAAGGIAFMYSFLVTFYGRRIRDLLRL